MYHSVTFITSGLWHPNRMYTCGEIRKNTWDDWHLIPTLRPIINPPSVKKEQTDVPIMDGVVDFSTEPSGSMSYGFRQGSIEFLAENGFRPWHELYSEIADYLHGQYARLILEDDPNYYYEGRLFVNEWRSDEHWSFVTIGYKLKPAKTAIETLDVGAGGTGEM